MKCMTYLFLFLLLAIACSAATITVNWDGSADYTTIKAGINAAVSGQDTVIVADAVIDGAGVEPLGTPAWKYKLIASDGADYNYFGVNVSIDGDTAVVGAYIANNGNGPESGSAYVYTRNGSTWVETELPADAAAGERFGRSVVIDGDTLAVGAVEGDAVYVYTRSGPIWSLQQKLTGVVGSNFGISVDIDGDTLIAGADAEDIGANLYQGAAYIYTRSGSTWTFRKKLIAPSPSPDPSPHYGYSVAIDGDTAAVGAYRYSHAALYSGSAYVYTGSGSTWNLQGNLGTLAGGDLEYGDYFGRSVDVNNDTVLVGANRDESPGGQADDGSAYVFVRNGSTWSKQQKLYASNVGDEGQFFGNSVSLLGDRALIGAYDDIIEGETKGAVHEFIRSGSTWTEQGSFITASDGELSDKFGCSVAMSEPFAIVGAKDDDNENGTNNPGAAYIYNLGLSPDSIPVTLDYGAETYVYAHAITQGFVTWPPVEDSDTDSDSSSNVKSESWAQAFADYSPLPGWEVEWQESNTRAGIEGNYDFTGAQLVSRLEGWGQWYWFSEIIPGFGEGNGGGDGNGYNSLIGTIEIGIFEGYPQDANGLTLKLDSEVTGNPPGNWDDWDWWLKIWDEDPCSPLLVLDDTNMSADLPVLAGEMLNIEFYHEAEEDSDPCGFDGWPEAGLDSTITVDLEVCVPGPADIDTSGYIDISDLVIVALQWLQAPGLPPADIAPDKPDNFVDYLDFAIVEQNWLRCVE